MSEKKHIDRLFQEKFKDFEVEPSDETWSYIEARLEEKKDRKIIPFWFQFAGVAAVLLIGLLIAFNMGNNDPKNMNATPVVSAPENNTKGDTTTGNQIGTPSNGLNGTPKNNEAVTNSGVEKSNTDGSKIATSEGDPNTGNGSTIANRKSKNLNERANKATDFPQNANQGVAGKQSNKSGAKNGSKKVQSVANDDAKSSREENESRYATTTGKGKKSGQKASSKANVSGVANDGTNSPANDSRYATTSDNKKSGKNATSKNNVSIGNENGSVSGKENDSRYATTSDPNKKGKSTNNNNETTTNQNLKNENNVSKQNQIAQNENNQSGKPQQHNNPEVTETKTTSTQAITAKTDDTKKDSTAIATVEEPNALEELLKNEKENKSVTQNEPKIDRWQVTTNVAPIYLSSTSEGSPIDSRFANNEKDYKTKLSYGVGLSYAVSKRLSVRAGVNSMSFEYDTKDVVFNQAGNARRLEHVKTNVQGSLLDIQSKRDPSVVNAAPELGLNGNITPQFDGSLNQKTGYIEVPVELAYKVIDRRFGVEVIGGFSTLFLNQNEVSVVSSSTEMEIGKANNLNDMHFSTNVGLGMKYNILKALQFKLEPMFKYQINTFSDSGNFKPYFFGVYTGLNYRF
ncbi:MAG: hypothetical protein EOO50_01020 [Flavobacterium sp.]|uniref:hypothetical protein n=1 Tax=Flavobacterium sp. TaxID=239 RepID=UPI00121477BF|nr:hypothetical protein [Flavobacterium sp.]RZJ68403.1 MAG: hypothetical protein EOO50_01020 [Flavobacterium sp.]